MKWITRERPKIDRITWDERVYLQWYPESPVVVTK